MVRRRRKPGGWTTIRVSGELHDRLAALGAKGETFDQIIRRAIGLQAGAKESENDIHVIL